MGHLVFYQAELTLDFSLPLVCPIISCACLGLVWLTIFKLGRYLFNFTLQTAVIPRGR